MNKWGEEGGPGVSLGRWENRKAADHSRQHWDQQVGEKAEKTWILNRRTGISRRVSLGYRHADRVLQKRARGYPDMDRKEDGDLW